MFKYPKQEHNEERKKKIPKQNKVELSRGENTVSEIKISLNGISRRLVGKKISEL